jgi:hypothetical protein
VCDVHNAAAHGVNLPALRFYTYSVALLKPGSASKLSQEPNTGPRLQPVHTSTPSLSLDFTISRLHSFRISPMRSTYPALLNPLRISKLAIMRLSPPCSYPLKCRSILSTLCFIPISSFIEDSFILQFALRHFHSPF